MNPDLLAVLGFAALFLLAIMRVPIGVAMAIVGLGGYAQVVGLEPALKQMSLVLFRAATTESFGLIPLFILMGAFATASGMSRELFAAARAWIGHRRGGLAMATVLACGGFAAVSGSSVATAVTMTRVALPEMRGAGYAPGIATGTIAAGGTLGILIPPSFVFAVYGIITEQDIGRLFIAGILPGIVTLVVFMATVAIIGRVSPGALPPPLARASWTDRRRATAEVWAMLLLFLFVIGGIYAGLFTPTEAAGAGAAGAFLIALARRRLTFAQTVDCLVETIRTSAAIFMIIFGALMFGFFLAVTRTPQDLTAALLGLDLGAYGTLALILVVYFVLGMVLDPMAMIVLTTPVILPVILSLGFDPIWFGVIVVVAVELAVITPPVGINVFVINSIAPEVSLPTIFRGALPFVAAGLVCLALFAAFPQIALFLPGLM